MERYGLTFHLKILDFFHWESARKREGYQDDLIYLVHLLHQSIGGREVLRAAAPGREGDLLRT